MELKNIVLPKNCFECKCYSAIEGTKPGYAGIQPKCCVLLNYMPHHNGIAIERPDFCPLNQGVLNFKNEETY